MDRYTLSEELGALLGRSNKSIVTAESCTGGMIASSITDIPGCSSWFSSGFVTYSNESKQQLLGVSSDLFDRYGAVSQEVVEVMLIGALSRSGANVGISVSGIAGPTGGTDTKPVGTVWIAWGSTSRMCTAIYTFKGDRCSVREQATEVALGNCIDWLK